MSKESLKQFVQKVTDDEQFQSRLGEEIDIDSLIVLGAEHGQVLAKLDLSTNPTTSCIQYQINLHLTIYLIMDTPYS